MPMKVEILAMRLQGKERQSTDSRLRKEATHPAAILSSAFWSPEPCANVFLVWEPPICESSLWPPEQTNTSYYTVSFLRVETQFYSCLCSPTTVLDADYLILLLMFVKFNQYTLLCPLLTHSTPYRANTDPLVLRSNQEKKD